MRYTILLILLMQIIGIGCRQSIAPVASYPWSILTITLEDNEVITVNNVEDTSMIKYYDGGSIFTGRHKVKIDSLKLYFTMAEKDTLYKLADSIIANPVQPERACTDFVGDLQLVINYRRYKNPGSIRQSIEYSGICNWDSLSDKTIKLHKILKRKIKWWNK